MFFFYFVNRRKRDFIKLKFLNIFNTVVISRQFIIFI